MNAGHALSHLSPTTLNEKIPDKFFRVNALFFCAAYHKLTDEKQILLFY